MAYAVERKAYLSERAHRAVLRELASTKMAREEAAFVDVRLPSTESGGGWLQLRYTGVAPEQQPLLASELPSIGGGYHATLDLYSRLRRSLRFAVFGSFHTDRDSARQRCCATAKGLRERQRSQRQEFAALQSQLAGRPLHAGRHHHRSPAGVSRATKPPAARRARVSDVRAATLILSTDTAAALSFLSLTSSASYWPRRENRNPS